MAQKTMNENYAARVVGTPGTWAAAAVYGTWIEMTGFNRITFYPVNGELDGNITLEVFQATDNAGSGAKEITSLNGVTHNSSLFTNGTDEGRLGIIEVLASDMDGENGFDFITLKVTPAATDTFACVALLGEPYEAPVANGTANGVAFNVGG